MNATVGACEQIQKSSIYQIILIAMQYTLKTIQGKLWCHKKIWWMNQIPCIIIAIKLDKYQIELKFLVLKWLKIIVKFIKRMVNMKYIQKWE